MMQLQFLGEAFQARDCRQMCDNCRAHTRAVQNDVTKEAIKLMQCINDINHWQGKITTKQLVDLTRGKSVKSVYLSRELTQRHSGLLKNMNESDIRRMIIKLLILGALEEVFI